jgi:hypothetical protein
MLDELQGSAVSRTYTYGLSLISQKLVASSSQLSFYGFDGHGSVRFLTDPTGAVTDTYDYDAFGNLIASTGTTPNNYLFAGEQFDPALGLCVTWKTRLILLIRQVPATWALHSKLMLGPTLKDRHNPTTILTKRVRRPYRCKEHGQRHHSS